MERPHLYRALFHAIPEPLLALAPSGEILEANAAAEALLGAGREALLGRPIFESFREDSADSLRSLLGRVTGSRREIRREPLQIAGRQEIPAWNGIPVFDRERRVQAVLLSLESPLSRWSGPEQAPAPSDPSNPHAMAPACSPERHPAAILLVEDHDDTRCVLSTLLRREGYRLVATATCREAMTAACEAARENRPFDVLISDLGLPDGSGLTLIREIKTLYPALNAIALSGYGSEDDVSESLKAGFARHYTKPVSIETLREAITRMAANG